MQIRPLFFLHWTVWSASFGGVISSAAPPKTSRDRVIAWSSFLFRTLLVWQLFGSPCFTAGLWAEAGLQGSASPNPPPLERLGPIAAVLGAAPKYEKPAMADIVSNRVRAFEFAEQTRLHIVATMHLVETAHFLIFSAWDRVHDAALSDVCERMYAKLAQQFDLPAGESVWVGKLPIYVFWLGAHYEKFTAEVDGSRQIDATMAHVTGYHASKGRFAYVVINGVSSFGANEEQAKLRFYHVLVHEGTHAFLHRYITERPMPLWIEEGLADFIAATLVPDSEANRSYIRASHAAVHDLETVRHVLQKKKDLTVAEYGLAQSLVRLLVQQDRVAMIRLLQLLKLGRSEKEALAAAYHISTDDLVRAWQHAWQDRRAG